MEPSSFHDVRLSDLGAMIYEHFPVGGSIDEDNEALVIMIRFFTELQNSADNAYSVILEIDKESQGKVSPKENTIGLTSKDVFSPVHRNTSPISFI